MSKSSSLPTKKLVIREIFGHRMRSISTFVAIAFVLILGLGMALGLGSMSKAVKEKFEKNELWDIKVSFKNPQMIFILNRLDGIPGVKSVEPYTLSDAEIVYKNRSTLGVLDILSKGTEMHEFSFAKGKVSDGLIISADVAHRLNVGVGDKVILSTHFMKEEKEISGITQEIGFSQGYLPENLPVCTGALLKVENGKLKEVEKSLQNLSFVNSWVKKSELKDGWLALTSLYMSFAHKMMGDLQNDLCGFR